MKAEFLPHFSFNFIPLYRIVRTVGQRNIGHILTNSASKVASVESEKRKRRRRKCNLFPFFPNHYSLPPSIPLGWFERSKSNRMEQGPGQICRIIVIFLAQSAYTGKIWPRIVYRRNLNTNMYQLFTKLPSNQVNTATLDFWLGFLE